MSALRELALGARLTLGGGRESLARTGLTVLGVGLGVALLLAAAAIPSASSARDDRSAERVEVAGGGRLLMAPVDTQFRGDTVIGRLMRPLAAGAPLPPGLERHPSPGEVVVSPELERLLRSSEGELLRPRVPGRVAGTIGDAGLVHPRELVFYAGSDALTRRMPEAITVRDFGGEYRPPPLDPRAYLVGTVAVIILLAPIAVFVATAVRVGGEARDRRLAAIRLVGADRAMTARIAAGEALVGALGGLVAGTALFLAARPLAERITAFDLSVFAHDIRPSLVLAVSIAVLVPLAAVLVTLLALRRLVVDPLGVVRRGRTRSRRFAWRLALPAAGLVLLLPLAGALPSDSNDARLMAGVGMLLAGLVTLLPWVVERSVAPLRGGGVPWQLATRRLQLDSGSAGRAAGAIAVAVAGAIALQMLIAGVEADQRRPDPGAAGGVQAMTTLASPHRAGEAAGAERSARLVAALEATPAVRGVVAFDEVFPSTPGAQDHRGSLLVGGCDVLRRYARIGRCRDGDAFIVRSREAGVARLPRRGELLQAGSGRWRVPVAARRARARPGAPGWPRAGVFATPAAVPNAGALGAQSQIYTTVDARDPDAIEHVRNAVAAVEPLTSVLTLEADDPDVLGSVRRAVLAAAAAVLVLIGASLLIAAVEQVRERRRLFAALVAVGVRPRTLAWSVLFHTAIPVLLGLGLAIGTGIGLGAVLLTIAGEPAALDPAGIAVLAGAAAVVVLVVTALTLPALARSRRPGALRAE